MKRKVIINKLPTAQMGGSFNAKAFPWPAPAGKSSEPNVSVNSTLKPVPRYKANLEAEKGEVAMLPDKGGIPSTFKIGGQRHTNGGTPLNLPPDSFIFSDTRDMRIKDPKILAQFGMQVQKSGYTPAEIAKKYDINKFKKILADPDTDDLQKSTAEGMIANFNLKLAKLGLIQESMKGFPQGIPVIAMPYIEELGIDPAEFAQANPEQGQSPGPDNAGMEMAYGGAFDEYKRGGSNKKKVRVNYNYQAGGQKDWDAYPEEGKFLLPHLVNEGALRKDKVKGHQGKLESGAFGDEKISLDQFMKNNPGWAKKFKETHSGETYDPKNSKHVGEFQEFFNNNTYQTIYDEAIIRGKSPDEAKQVATKMVDSYGFKEGVQAGSGDPRGKDSKHGQYTGSRIEIGFKHKDTPLEEPEPVVGNAKLPAEVIATQAAHLPENVKVPGGSPWWLQDIIKTAHAAGNLARIERFMPWQGTPGVRTPRVSFLDPNRELAQNAEMANIAGQQLQAFTGPQAYNARFNQIQGQGLRGAADTIGRVHNQNVQISNTQEAENARIMNEHENQRAGLATSLWDKYQTVNQNFSSAKANARDVLVNQYVNAITNKNYTANLNKMNPQFAINPAIGGEYYFRDPRALKPDFSQQPDFTSVYNKLLEENPTLKDDPKQASNIALKILGMGPVDEDPFLQYQKNKGIIPQYPGGQEE